MGVNSFNNGYIGINNRLSNGVNNTREDYVFNRANLGPVLPVVDEYVRPSEWVSLPSVTGGQVFHAAYAVYDNDSNFLAFTISGNYLVNWGDGTTSAHSSATTAYKRYTRATYAGLTSAVYKDYKTLLITITPQAGATFTSFEFYVKHNQTNLTNGVATGFLDIRMAGTEVTALKFGAETGTPVVTHPLLEQFEYVGTNKITSIFALFMFCSNLQNLVSLFTGEVNSSSRLAFAGTRLQKLPPLDLRKVTSGNRLFMGMAYLRSFPEVQTPNLTSCWEIFTGNSSLKTVPLFDTSKVTDFRQMFQDCFSLETIPQFNTSAGTNFGSMFSSCFSLKNVPRLDTSKGIDLGAMFVGCRSLLEVELNCTNATSLYLTFWECFALEKITLISPKNVTNYLQAFGISPNLKQIIGLDTSVATNFAATFRDLDLLNVYSGITASNVTNFGSMFWQNDGIVEAPEMDTSKGLDFNQMFIRCSRLRKVPSYNLSPTTGALAAGAYNRMFEDCRLLRIVPPMNVSGASGATWATIYTDMFKNCTAITEVGITGIQHSISFSSCNMGATALNTLYTNLATVGASGSATKTITVTGNWGASAALGYNP